MKVIKTTLMMIMCAIALVNVTSCDKEDDAQNPLVGTTWAYEDPYDPYYYDIIRFVDATTMTNTYYGDYNQICTDTFAYTFDGSNIITLTLSSEYYTATCIYTGSTIIWEGWTYTKQ